MQDLPHGVAALVTAREAPPPLPLSRSRPAVSPERAPCRTMVMLHVKKTDELQFLFETAVKNSVDETVTELVEIWNMQIQVSYP